jgi:hypothetical protein
MVRFDIPLLNGDRERIYIDTSSIARERIKKEDIKMKYKKPGKKTIKKLEELPFIEKVEIGEDKYSICFKPTFVAVDKYADYSHGPSKGKRILWIGKVKMRVFKGEYNKQFFDFKCETIHPHISSSGNPCFGSARSEANKLFNTGQIVKFTQFIWFWLHKCNNEGHNSLSFVYRYLLVRGYPIWDGKRKRIKTKVKKLKCYKKNLKKFKDMKCPI